MKTLRPSEQNQVFRASEVWIRFEGLNVWGLSDLLQEAPGWFGTGDVGVVGVVVGGAAEVTLDAAVMQGDLVVSCFITAPRHTLNTVTLHLWHTEGGTKKWWDPKVTRGGQRSVWPYNLKWRKTVLCINHKQAIIRVCLTCYRGRPRQWW